MTEYIVVGAGRIGSYFATLGNSLLIRRGDTIPNIDLPILVCTRNDDLEGVLSQLHPAQYSQLIFVQNGMLNSWFIEKELMETTQALLYIAISQRGDSPIDGKRSVVTGKNADFLKSLMVTGNLKCEVVTNDRFQREMVEKFLWNCCFGLLSQYFQQSVGEIVHHHKEICSSLIQESIDISDRALQLGISETERIKMEQRLCDYSLSIYDYRGAVKEWRWRNGWLWEQQPAVNSIHGHLLTALQLV